jgi:integrase
MSAKSKGPRLWLRKARRARTGRITHAAVWVILDGKHHRWKRLGQTFVVEWNGRAVKDCDKAFRHVANAAGLSDVTPHIIRHTCATWLAQSGAATWESAGFLGMTEKQFEETYGHHHPDHLRGPRDALDRPPMLRQRMIATERERTLSNVTKIADRSR